MAKEISKEEYEENIDKLFHQIAILDELFTNDFVEIADYWKIKNRILDEMIDLWRYYSSKEGD